MVETWLRPELSRCTKKYMLLVIVNTKSDKKQETFSDHCGIDYAKFLLKSRGNNRQSFSNVILLPMVSQS